jgi:excisionase family DNA binding protein
MALIDMQRAVEDGEVEYLMSNPYTPDTLAKRWNCSSGKVRRLCRTGALDHFKLGPKLIRITAKAVQDYERGVCDSDLSKDGGTSSSETGAVNQNELASEPKTRMRLTGNSQISSEGRVVRL